MILEPLAQRLENEEFGVIGTSIFMEAMPSECEAGILLKTPLVGIPVLSELPGYYRGQVQIIIRSTSHAMGTDISNRVMAAMTHHAIREFRTGGGELLMIVNQMLPETLPIRYPRSDGHKIEWSINFATSFWLPT